jgi:DNA-binding transcriptional MocR family regulator
VFKALSPTEWLLRLALFFLGTGKFSNHMRISFARPYEDGYENFFKILGRLINQHTS